MYRKKEVTYRLRQAFAGLASALLIMLSAVMFISPGFVYAEGDEPIREVHNVRVGNEAYCFFVTHNVVLTPAEVAEMTDDELTAAVIGQAGLYMIKTNCKVASHKIITAENWSKTEGSFLLSEADIASMRTADPVTGEPLKFYMDLMVNQQVKEESEDGEEEEQEETPEEEPEEEPEVIPVYSTYKRTGPRLLFAVVATEEDAKLGEDYCKDNSRPGPVIDPGIGSSASEDDEMLPEYRTIKMADRSGAPVKATLEDGSPVNLEWIEPKHIINNEKTSFLDHIPGGSIGLIAMASVLLAAVIAILIAAKRRKSED